MLNFLLTVHRVFRRERTPRYVYIVVIQREWILSVPCFSLNTGTLKYLSNIFQGVTVTMSNKN